MENQIKQLDFTGTNFFVGIDVHKKSWKVCIRTKETELRTFSQNPCAQELVAHLRQNYPGGEYRVVYEAGFCGFGYQREFEREGIHCMVVHPADVPTNDKERQRKSDIVDCRKLSHSLSQNSLEAIHVPSLEQQHDRGIVRVYQQLVKDQTRMKNRIKSWLHFQGVPLPKGDEHTYWSNNFLVWLKTLSLPPSARTGLDMLVAQYEGNRGMVLTASKQLRALSAQDRYRETIGLLRSIPGIGQVAAITFATAIGDINRFAGLAPLCDYVGLVPRVHSSSDTERVMGLTHRGHHKLRETLIEASWTAIRQDPAMTMAFAAYSKRMKKNKAIIKIARKMLNRIRCVLKNRMPYVMAVVG